MGGRYQNDQASFSGCIWPTADPEGLASVIEVMFPGFPTALEASFVAPCLGTADPMAESKGLPGVFGVFAEPNEAKAPEPRPKALAAPPPAVGEASALPGLEGKPPDLPSWRLDEEEANRPESVVPPLAGVDKESLLVLFSDVNWCL